MKVSKQRNIKMLSDEHTKGVSAFPLKTSARIFPARNESTQPLNISPVNPHYHLVVHTMLQVLCDFWSFNLKQSVEKLIWYVGYSFVW